MSITAAQLFARLPLGMLALAILLHVQALTHSYALAGSVVASLSIGEAIAMPVTTRLTGRLGMVWTLGAAALVNALSMIGLAMAGANGAVLMTLGCVMGATVPPLMPVIRALYPQMVPREGVRALFALDASAQELIWVIGPVAAITLASLVSPSLPLYLSAAITVLGTAWFLIGTRHFRPRLRRNTGAFGKVLLNGAVLLAMIVSSTLVASFMALQVAVMAALSESGVIAGVAIALVSVGSLVGGLAFGHRRLGLVGMVVAIFVVVIGILLYWVLDSVAMQLMSLFTLGLGFTPAQLTTYLMVSRQIEESLAMEAFGWLNSAALVGGAIGTAVAGVVVDVRGPQGAIAVAVLLGCRLTGPHHVSHCIGDSLSFTC